MNDEPPQLVDVIVFAVLCGAAGYGIAMQWSIFITVFILGAILFALIKWAHDGWMEL